MNAVKHRKRRLVYTKAPRTHCANGHPWSRANTRISVEGYLKCRACVRISKRAERARQLALGGNYENR
jgi:hypothetical protein